MWIIKFFEKKKCILLSPLSASASSNRRNTSQTHKSHTVPYLASMEAGYFFDQEFTNKLFDQSNENRQP